MFRWSHPASGARRWRFGWRQAGESRWRWVTKRTKAEARAEAEAVLERLERAELVWERLDGPTRAWLAEVVRLSRPGDREAVLAFLRARQGSGEIGAVVARFLAAKVAARGSASRHLDQLGRDLGALAGAFAGSLVADVTADQLARWLDGRAGAAGRARRQGIRRTLVQFWRWCRRDGVVGNEAVTAADRLPSLAVGPGRLRVLDPAELRVILDRVEWEFLPWVILGAFAGLRPEELAPRDGSKQGLRWEHLDAGFGVIRVPAVVSKVRRARIVPLLPTCRAWLEAFGWEDGWTGAVCLRNPAQARETARMGRILDLEFGRAEGWPADALRHSYGSYRNGQLRSLEQVAEEMGTSVAMLHRHYHCPRSSGEAEGWFSVLPLGQVIRVCSDENEVRCASLCAGEDVERPKMA